MKHRQNHSRKNKVQHQVPTSGHSQHLLHKRRLKRNSNENVGSDNRYRSVEKGGAPWKHGSEGKKKKEKSTIL